jgi:hypothetical protein
LFYSPLKNTAIMPGPLTLNVADEAALQTLDQGPAVGIPPKRLMANEHEIGASFDKARREVEEDVSSRSTSPSTPPASVVTDKYAFAFDIDGVLIRGGKPIPEAVKAMKMLNGQNEYGVRV